MTSSNQPTFTRPVSPNEWLYVAGAPLAPPFAIQLVVTGNGWLTQDELVRAVEVAGVACPGSRLVRDDRTWVDSGVAPPVRIVATPDFTEPLTASCEVLLAGDTVVFRAFHGVMDGRGALIWATDVFRALRGEAVSGATSPLTDYTLLDSLGAVDRRATLPLTRRSPVGGGSGHGWLRRTLDGNHAGLVAKVAAALASDRPARFMIPVDLRRHAPDVASTANLSLPIFLDGAAGTPWQEWHQQLLRALADRRELTAGIAERAALRLPQRALSTTLASVVGLSRRLDRHACTALVSHLGRIDLAAFSTTDFTAATLYSVPVHAPLAPVSLVATEPGGRTELTMSFPDGPGAADRAEELLDRVCDALVPASMRNWAGNDTSREYPSDTTVVELFRHQAEATPDAVALAGPAGDITYAELLGRAGAIAAALAGCGVGQGSIVGILADRSVGALAALWGVLMAGAAYLPLDPAYPDARIDALLTDAGAAVGLADRRTPVRVPAPKTTEACAFEFRSLGAEFNRRTDPDDLAYVIYTSGSTGKPKGVQISHRSLVNYVTWASRLYRVDAGTRFALFTSLAFDLSGTAIFPPLLAGGSIALVPEEVSPATLRHVLHGCGANTLKLTPAHLDLIGMLDLTATGFRALVVGGEQLTTAVAARAQRAFGPDCRIVNEYGPTEATIGCVVHVFDGDVSTAAVPIGRPVDNTRVYLLDADRRPVAPGVAGELYLTGAQLARGYLGRPDRFTCLADGSRAYRTGDLARLLPSGVLEYLGRADDQIKIRGYRVEPGEVEAALAGHPSVRRAAVVGRARPGSRDTVLCAYVVADRDADELRPYLAERLPAHLVPSYLRAVDELPLTSNGKVDVRALPDPFAAGYPAAYLTQSDPTEAAVARIWSRILSVPAGQLGPDADFHTLGGDSLSMIEMIVSVGRTVVGPAGEEAFHAELAMLISEPTLARVVAAATPPKCGGFRGP